MLSLMWFSFGDKLCAGEFQRPGVLEVVRGKDDGDVWFATARNLNRPICAPGLVISTARTPKRRMISSVMR